MIFSDGAIQGEATQTPAPGLQKAMGWFEGFFTNLAPFLIHAEKETM